jgi:hypothetical protein
VARSERPISAGVPIDNARRFLFQPAETQVDACLRLFGWK